MKKENSFMKGLFQKIVSLLRMKKNKEFSESNITPNIDDTKKNNTRRPEAAREL